MDLQGFKQLVNKHGGSVPGVFDQAEDWGLSKDSRTKSGACEALCWKWLGSLSLQRPFWASTFQKGTHPGYSEVARGNWAGQHLQLTSSGVDTMVVVMDRFASAPDGAGRIQVRNKLAAALGFKTYSWTGSDQPLWNAGNLADSKGQPSALVEAVTTARAYCLVALRDATDEGHAIAFAHTKRSISLFDPNWGQAKFSQDKSAGFKAFFPEFWAGSTYARDFTQYSIHRYSSTALA